MSSRKTRYLFLLNLLCVGVAKAALYINGFQVVQNVGVESNPPGITSNGFVFASVTNAFPCGYVWGVGTQEYHSVTGCISYIVYKDTGITSAPVFSVNSSTGLSFVIQDSLGNIVTITNDILTLPSTASGSGGDIYSSSNNTFGLSTQGLTQSFYNNIQVLGISTGSPVSYIELGGTNNDITAIISAYDGGSANFETLVLDTKGRLSNVSGGYVPVITGSPRATYSGLNRIIYSQGSLSVYGYAGWWIVGTNANAVGTNIILIYKNAFQFNGDGKTNLEMQYYGSGAVIQARMSGVGQFSQGTIKPKATYHLTNGTWLVEGSTFFGNSGRTQFTSGLCTLTFPYRALTTNYNIFIQYETTWDNTNPSYSVFSKTLSNCVIAGVTSNFFGWFKQDYGL